MLQVHVATQKKTELPQAVLSWCSSDSLLAIALLAQLAHRAFYADILAVFFRTYFAKLAPVPLACR